MARDYYAILGVERGASEQELKRAYRRLARELHPDVNPDDSARERFEAVGQAYEVLSDPEKRRIVDAGGDPLESPSGFGGFGGFGSGGINDVFDAFFGGGGSGGRGPRSRVQPGDDALLRVDLSLAECATGVRKDVTVDTAVLCDLCQGRGTDDPSTIHTCATCRGTGEVQSVQRSFLGNVMTSRPCPTCHGVGEIIPNPCGQCNGDGRVRARRTIGVKIPAGVAEGMRIRLSGQGEVGPGGGPAGDLYVEVREQSHDTFVRDGENLRCTIRIPMADAALGTKVAIDTLIDGVEEFEIEPGTQPGAERVLPAHGMPRLRGSGRGDLIAHIEVIVPERLTSKEAVALREFSELRADHAEIVTAKSAHRGGMFSRLREAFSGR